MQRSALFDFVALVSLIVLYGCSEESSLPSAQETSTDQKEVVPTIFELGKCDQSTDGAVVFVEDQSADYYCDGKSWKINKADDVDGEETVDTDDEEVDDDEEDSSNESVKPKSNTSKAQEDDSGASIKIPLSSAKSSLVTTSSSSAKRSDSSSGTSSGLESAPSSSGLETNTNEEENTSSSSAEQANPPKVDEVAYQLDLAKSCNVFNIGHVVYIQSEDQGYICTEAGYETISIERPDEDSSSSVANSSETQNPESSAENPSSSEVSVSTITDSRDGNEYKIVTIGSQIWMAENLNYVTTDGFADNKKGSWCYNNQTANCSEYGRLYTWAAAMNVSDDYNTDVYNGTAVTGICPSGFRLPSNDDWQILADFISDSPHNLTDYGFSFQHSGHYQDIAEGGIIQGFDYGPNASPISGMEFWSSTQEGDTKASHREYFSSNTLSVKSKLKIHAYSVRCVRNAFASCTEAKVGEFKKTNDDILICKLNGEEFQWQYASSSEQLDYHFGRCSSALLNEYREKGGYIYICKRRYYGVDSNLVARYEWEMAQGSDLYGYALDDFDCEDKVVKSSSFQVKQPLLPYGAGREFYYCDEGEWRNATMLEYDTYNQACTNRRVIEGNQNTDRYYYCDEGEWRNATKLEYDTYGQECTDGRIIKGNVDTTTSYYCASGTWRVATTTEIDTYGQECFLGNVVPGNVNVSTYYFCSSTGWRVATTIEIDTYGQECTDGRIVKGNVNTNTSYYCAFGTWRVATTTEIDTYGQECFLGNVVPGNVNVSTYYFCSSTGWRTASTLETDTFGEECSEPRAIQGNVYPGNFYICDSTKWKSVTKKEADTYLQTCKQDSVVNGNVTALQYICLDEKWFAYGCEGSSCNPAVTLLPGESVTWNRSTPLIIHFDQTKTYYYFACSFTGNGTGIITVAGGQVYTGQWHVSFNPSYGGIPEYAVVEAENGSIIGRCGG